MTITIHRHRVAALLVAALIVSLAAPVAMAATPAEHGLREGDVIRADGDEDVYIVNEHGFKRLFVNEAIFGIYGHLGFDKVRVVAPSVRDAFPTSGLFRNCESGDERVFGLDVRSADSADLRWIDTTGAAASRDDPDFFRKVFCINNAEQALYGSGAPYRSVRDVPVYTAPSLRPTSQPSTSVLSGHTPASVYSSFARSVAQLLCFEFDGNDKVTNLWGGSGTVMRNRTGVIQLLTNNHVVPQDGFCLAEFWVEPSLSFFASNRTFIYAARFSEHLSTHPDDDEAIMLLEPVSSDLIRTFRDGGLINEHVSFPDSLDEATRIAQRFVCLGTDAEIGDEVAIIGYPSIGSTVGPTLTRGNIAGREGNFYVTDAKIERGNSGGAAILIKKNCYLGIPTSVVAGTHESLGRILDITRFQVFGTRQLEEDDIHKASILDSIIDFFR